MFSNFEATIQTFLRLIFVYRGFFCLQLETNLSVSCFKHWTNFFLIAGFCLVFVLFFDVLCFFPFFFLLLGEIKDLRQWITTSFISWENLRIILFCRIVHLIFTWDNWIKSISQWILVVPTTHVSYRIINNRRVNVEQGLLRFFSNYSFFFYTLKFRH